MALSDPVSLVRAEVVRDSCFIVMNILPVIKRYQWTHLPNGLKPVDADGY